ncbi:MAG: beta-ketoacyl-[acyl-carrier-protein] synthase family protein [Nitrospira sp.]|nr:beta-ketoacyl-[acyl-carrier-protein] synthase family protein [Nitrospira sp.]
MKRIVVTGIGCISSLGHNCAEFSEALLAGQCGIAPITLLDTSEFRVKIAAEVKDYDERNHFSEQQIKKIDRYAQFNILASREAVKDAGLEIDKKTSERTAVVQGTGIGGQRTQESGYRKLFTEGAKRLHPFTIPKLIPSSGASWVSIDLGITGPSFSTTSACSSSSHAIGMALLMLRSGIADVAVTGGSEAQITFATLKAWEGLRVMDSTACRPFSLQRGGMVLGEGAGTIILETLDHALARGARIYAELSGLGMSSDAHDMLQPDPAGAGRAIKLALADAGISPEAVDYINAHGTGTKQNDSSESKAINTVFGAHAKKIAVSSTKSMHGHALGAAAALESIATIIAIREQTALPTINFLDKDPECELDFVPNSARPMTINTALSNSFAFGGLNAVLVFRKFNNE